MRWGWSEPGVQRMEGKESGAGRGCVGMESGEEAAA